MEIWFSILNTKKVPLWRIIDINCIHYFTISPNNKSAKLYFHWICCLISFTVIFKANIAEIPASCSISEIWNDFIGLSRTYFFTFSSKPGAGETFSQTDNFEFSFETNYLVPAPPSCHRQALEFWVFDEWHRPDISYSSVFTDIIIIIIHYYSYQLWSLFQLCSSRSTLLNTMESSSRMLDTAPSSVSAPLESPTPG